MSVQNSSRVGEKAPDLFEVDSDGAEVVPKSQQERVQELEITSAEAREDNKLAFTLQEKPRRREHALIDSSKIIKKKTKGCNFTATISEILVDIGFVRDKWILYQQKVTREGVSQLCHYKRCDKKIASKDEKIKEAKVPEDEGMLNKKSLLFGELVIPSRALKKQKSSL